MPGSIRALERQSKNSIWAKMIELIIAFFVGFVLSRFTISKAYVDLRAADKLLRWDQECLGWRPVFSRDQVEPNKIYLAAFEVSTDNLIAATEEQS